MSSGDLDERERGDPRGDKRVTGADGDRSARLEVLAPEVAQGDGDAEREGACG
jgi:hypothetical protein